jgi:uncharacterized protein YkwD
VSISAASSRPLTLLAVLSATALSACYVGIEVDPSDWYGYGDTYLETGETGSEGASGDQGDGDPTTTGDGDPTTTGDGDGDPTTTGDGDGDPTTTGDGDGDPTTTGDGDGDPTTTGDGDGDPTTTGDGDGDGDPTTTGDGDGDPTTTGDGDGDPTTTTGDGDGDPTTTTTTTTGGGNDPEPLPDNAYCNPVSDWPQDWIDAELEVLDLVNQARAQGGNCGTEGNFPPSGPLEWHPALTCAARVHSKDMADNDFFSHTNLQGNGPGWRLAQAGYNGGGWGENIAAGYGDPNSVVQGWLDSDGHCANMLNPNFSLIGIGYAYGDGQWGHYWTQTFGN